MPLGNDDVDNLPRYDDDLADLLSFNPFLRLLVGQYGAFDSSIVHVDGEVEGKAHLAIEGDAIGDGTLLEILLVVFRPLGIADAAFEAQLGMEFFGDVRSKRSDGHDKFAEDSALAALQLAELVDADHEGADRSVWLQAGSFLYGQ